MEIRDALLTLKSHREKLTRQQVLTIRGQILRGDIDGAMKGLQKCLQKGRPTQKNASSIG